MYGRESLAAAEADRIEELVHAELDGADPETVAELRRRHCTVVLPSPLASLPQSHPALSELTFPEMARNQMEQARAPSRPTVLSGLFGNLLG